jgi:Zn finger protein HypA/HybF involved in hydrogenase expression
VDVKALAKAFDQLEAQTFDLEGCDITVTGARAEADCAGNARYVRKVGNRALRVEPRRWRFALRQANGQWVIDAVDAR